MKFHHKKATITIYFLLFLSWMSLFINATEKSNDTQDKLLSDDTSMDDIDGNSPQLMDTIIFSLGDDMENISLEPKDESMIRKKNIASLEESQENGFCSPEGEISTICFGNYRDEKPAKPFFTCKLSQDESNFPWEIRNEGDFVNFHFSRFEQRAPRKREFTWATTSREEREKNYAEYIDLTSEPQEDFQSQLKRLDRERYPETETFCKCVARQFFSEPVEHICNNPRWE